jgi:hypothetical protein
MVELTKEGEEVKRERNMAKQSAIIYEAKTAQPQKPAQEPAEDFGDLY